MSRGLNWIFIWGCPLKRWGKCDLWEDCLLFVLFLMLHVQNMICAFFLYAVGNLFHGDHLRDEAQRASNTTALEEMGASGALGSESSTSVQPESLSFLQEDCEDTWMKQDKRTLVWKTAKTVVPEKYKGETPFAAQTLWQGKKNTKHIITFQISMLLLDSVFPGSILSMTNVNAIKPC